MAVYGLGSVCGALAYSNGKPAFRNFLVNAGAPEMIGSLAIVGIFLSFPTLLAAWAIIGAVIGAVQSLLGVKGSELLAANSDKQERAQIFAAHFALCHAG